MPRRGMLLPRVAADDPGMYAYRAVQALISCMCHSGEAEFNHHLSLFAQNGLTCAFIVLAMVIGANIPVFLLKKTAFQATR